MQFIPNSPIPPSGMISRTLAIKCLSIACDKELARVTSSRFHLYYPPHDQDSTGPVIRSLVCRRGVCCNSDDAAGLLPHRRCVAGSVQRRSRRDRATAVAREPFAGDRFVEPRQVLL